MKLLKSYWYKVNFLYYLKGYQYCEHEIISNHKFIEHTFSNSDYLKTRQILNESQINKTSA